MNKIAFVAHGKPEAEALQARLTGALAARGVRVVEDAPDLVLSLGGDGTMLRAAKVAHAADASLLGVNLGTLGYLTEIEAADAERAVMTVLDGEFAIEERTMLTCEVDGAPASSPALNEILLERTSGRLIRLEVTVGGEALAGFNADGLLVATPSGSTAYALSAGGPLVSPRADCLVLVPVNAHMLFARTFVLAADEAVEVRLGGDHEPASLVLDGQEEGRVRLGQTVRIARHDRALRLVRLAGPGFIERLRVKLGLPG